MTSTNEQINITGYFLTGMSLTPLIPFVSLDLVSHFLLTMLLSFFGATLFMNRGSKWIVNVLAQKEPLVFSLGLSTFSIAFKFLMMYPVAPESQGLFVILGLVTGLILMAVGLVSRYTDFLDL